MAQEDSMSGKFSQNTGQTQGIWFAQVVNSLILKLRDINFGHLPRKFPIFFSWIRLPIQVCVCNSNKSRKFAQGKFAVAQEKHREIENAI